MDPVVVWYDIYDVFYVLSWYTCIFICSTLMLFLCALVWCMIFLYYDFIMFFMLFLHVCVFLLDIYVFYLCHFLCYVLDIFFMSFIYVLVDIYLYQVFLSKSINWYVGTWFSAWITMYVISSTVNYSKLTRIMCCRWWDFGCHWAPGDDFFRAFDDFKMKLLI